jgi:hypothetical protein
MRSQSLLVKAHWRLQSHRLPRRLQRLYRMLYSSIYLDSGTDTYTTVLSHHLSLTQNQQLALQYKGSEVFKALYLLHDQHHRLYAAAAVQLEARGASRPPPSQEEGAKKSETLLQKNWQLATEKGQKSRLLRTREGRRRRQRQQGERPAS